MKLYYLPGACSLASHISLIWSGVDYELERLEYSTMHGEAFMSLNPKGAVPTLVMDDVAPHPFVLTESLAVLLYIAAQAPGARLGAVEGDRIEEARMHEIMAELVSDVHKAFTPTFVPNRFVVDPNAEDDVKKAAFIQIDKAFAQLEARLNGHDWLVLDRRTVADAYLNVVCRWKVRTPTGLAAFPNLMAHHSRMAADPDVQRALAEEGLPAD